MQIHEITEGLLSNVARGFASGVTGMDIPQSQASIDRQAAQAAEKLQAQGYNTYALKDKIERIVVSVMKPDQTYPTKYIKTGTTWTNQDGTVITKATSKAYLDSLIPTHGKKEVVPVAPTPQIKKVSRQRTPRRNTVKR
jgi:hypothetical protein